MIGALKKLEARARKCRRCPLHRTRTNVVFGSGPDNASVMLVGEGPGRQEDLAGLPFVGAAGRRLERLLKLASLRREDVYITNVVLCRPPDNRRPEPEEVKACKMSLEKRISIIRPRVIVTLGKTASETLLGKSVRMEDYHGGFFDSVIKRGTGLFITYHPAAALYSGRTSERIERDFRKLGALLRRLHRGECAGGL